MKQIAGGAVTTYTQDLAASLPVVLQSKTVTATTQYVYDMDTSPLAQSTSGAWQYLLPDGLGSVRQIADAGGNIILTQGYDPYGNVLNSSGKGNSVYGFTGEERDGSGLTYLRARYMQPQTGIFLSHDPINGDAWQPESMNGWNYASANPINHLDPSGRDAGIITVNCLANLPLCLEILFGGIVISADGVAVLVVAGATYALVNLPWTFRGGGYEYKSPPYEDPPAKTRPDTQPKIREPEPGYRVGDDGGNTGRAPAPQPERVPEPKCDPKTQIDPVYPRIPTATPTSEPNQILDCCVLPSGK